MAVTPNTAFTSGQILTAAQMNAFPRGLMTDIVSDTTGGINLTTAEVTMLTSGSFTAVTGRLYRITYYEPRVRSTTNAGSTNSTNFYIYNGATALNEASGVSFPTNVTFPFATCVYVGTLTAGATTITAKASASSTDGTPQLQRTATRFAFLIIEDIGAA
jgi:hypothetical protein